MLISDSPFLLFGLSLTSAWLIWYFGRFLAYIFYEKDFEQKILFLETQEHLRNIPLRRTVSPKKLPQKYHTGWLSHLEKSVQLAFPNYTFHSTILGISILAGIIAIGSVVLFKNMLIPLVIFLLIFLGGSAFIYNKAASIRKRYSDQLPDILEAWSNALQAGYSFPQALIFVERETLPPLKGLLAQAVKEMEYQFPLERVLKNMKEQAGNKDLELVIEGLIMQIRVGGNIITMLKKEAEMIRERLRLEKDLKTNTSQGRLSGIIITLLWPLSALLFYFLSPEYISILFTTEMGRSLIFVAVILEIIGFTLIWRITTLRI